MSRFAALGLLIVSAFVSAPAADIEIPYEKFVLDNGLTVIVHEDHKAPVVAVNIWYHVGSKSEKPGKTGFAHLFEHLMFGGSENFKGRYIDAMERIGATDLNGTTNEDRTNYFENVPTSALDYTLFLESDRMGHFFNTINKEVLDLQRGVVQNEKRQGENQPYAVSYELITKNTFPASHPYSWTVIGSMEDLNAASVDDVKEWFKTYYGPSNAVLVLAGDIDAKTAKEKVAKYFGDIPAGPPVAHQQVWVAKMSGTHRGKVQDRVPQARLYKVWNVPQYGSADGDYLNLVAACLAEGKSSRLYKRLVYDEQIATNVRSFLDEREIASQFYIDVTARPGLDLSGIEKAVDEELNRFLKEGPTPEELERVRTQYRATFIRGIERIGGFGGKSDHLAISQTYLGSPDAYKATLKRVESATAGNLKDAANSWLSDGVYVLEVLPYPEYKTAVAGVDRSKLPAIGTPPELKLPALQRDKLSNGLQIILAERHEIPVVNFWLAVDAGYAADQFASPGTASLTATLLTEGTKSRNALEISDQLQLLGAQLTASSNLDFSLVRLSALKEKLDPSLNLFADVVLNPTFPESDFKRQQKQRLASIQREKVTPTSMALRVFPPLLYGKNHAYGIPLTGSGTAESVAGLSRDDLVKFHQTWFRPNNATLVIVGDTTMSELKPKLEQLLTGWKGGKVPTKNIGTVSAPGKPAVYLIDKPGALQSTIIAGTIAPPKKNPQEISLETMNNILGGTFGGRINMNLREEKHWSYGAQSLMFGARAQRPFITYAPVQTDKTKESLQEISKEFQGVIGNKPITEEELEKAKANQTLKLPGSRETVDSVGRSIQDLVQYQLPDDYYETYAGKVRALRTADMQDSAKSLIDPAKVLWVVVGDRSKIEQGVRELNLGELHFIDADGKPVEGAAAAASGQSLK